MVSANGGTTTILKARFGNDIRRKSIHHGNDLTLNDLALMLQRVFSINSSDIQLKYRDADGDFVTIADDTDLLLALHEPTLFVEVIVGAESNASDLFQQIQKIQQDVGRLSVLATSLVAGQAGGERVQKRASYLPPASPEPAEERSELPATIQPSHHEEVNSHYDQVITSSSEVSAPLEHEIPLEADAHDSFHSHVQDPHVHFNAPPTASIPQFPTSNAPAPIQPEAQYGFPGGVPGAPGHFAPPPQQYQQPPQHQPPTGHSSVSSTPIPQQFGGHPGFPGGAPPPQGSPHVGFAPPSQAPGQFAPPQGFHLPPTPQQQQGPPPMNMPPQQQQFAPPPMGGAPPPQQFSPPSEPAPPQHPGAPQFAPPPNFGNPQQQQQQFNAPGQFAPPPQMGGPPPMGAPQMGGPQMGGPPPQMGGPPTMGPPMGAGMPGPNPFARVPPAGPYRQSPYHQ